MDWLGADARITLLVALTAMAVFILLVALTRISGVRSFSKMSGFDFAITVAIGSIVATVIITKDPPLANGAAALIALFAIKIGFATLRSRFGFVQDILDNRPRLIMIGDQIQHDQLKKAKMTESDLMAKLREANVLHFRQVSVVVAETTGDVSVLHSDEQDARVQKRILDNVVGADRLATGDSW